MSIRSNVPTCHVPAIAWGGAAITGVIAAVAAAAVASLAAHVGAVLSDGVADLLVALL